MSFNLSTFIFEIINFLALVYVLQRLLYRPLHQMIDRRREAITRAQEETREATREAEELRGQLQARMTEAEGERQQLIAGAREEAGKQRQSILEGADAEARQRLEDARTAIAAEQKDAREALRDDVTRDALQLTARLLQEASDSTLQHHLIQRLVTTLDAIPAEERVQLARGVLQGDRAVLRSASAPERGDLEAVASAVDRLLGKDVHLDVRTQPDLIGGVQLQLDGHVWDASLAQALQGVVRDEH
jgi:F-type H+-transporting ATPase subunit b